MNIRSFSLCSLYYAWDVLDDKIGERHYSLLISNVTSWFSGTILTDKTCMFGVATRSTNFMCFLCKLFSPTYHSEGDRWTPKLNDGNSRLRLYSVFCLSSHLLSYKMNYWESALLSLGCCQFCFFFFPLWVYHLYDFVYIVYFGHLRWFFSSQLFLTAGRYLQVLNSLAMGLTWSLFTKQMVNAWLSFCCCECERSKCTSWHPSLLLTGIGVFANLREYVKLGMESSNKKIWLTLQLRGFFLCVCELRVYLCVFL